MKPSSKASLLIVAAALLLHLSQRAHAQSPSTLEVQIRQTFGNIQDIVVKDLDTDVPARAVSLLPVLKHGLRDLFTYVLEESKDASAADLKVFFEKAITQTGLTIGDPWQDQTVFKTDDPVQQRLLEHPYGLITAVDVEMDQNRLIVATTVSIACGSDTSLYVFERVGGNWHRTLDFESNGYKTVAGAHGGFDWKAGGGSKPGEWFLVAADVNPWCSSNWQQLRWSAIRPGTRPDRPMVLSTGHATTFLEDETYRLDADGIGFRLVWWGEDTLDLDVLVRPHVARYTVTGSSVERVPPIAFRPDDFVDEWTRTPWQEAAQWTRAAAQSSARTWHSLLSNRPRGVYTTGFGSVQACPEPMTWQVGLEFEPLTASKRLPYGVPDRLFFLIARGDSRFELVNVATRPFSRCPGRTPPPPRAKDLPE